MSEIPASSENQNAVSNTNESTLAPSSSEAQSVNSLENSNLQQPEVGEMSRKIEGEKNQQAESEVVLPPVLQSSVPMATEVTKPISQDYINKGAKISPLTHIALETFRELQRKLAVHYQKMKQGTSI